MTWVEKVLIRFREGKEWVKGVVKVRADSAKEDFIRFWKEIRLV